MGGEALPATWITESTTQEQQALPLTFRFLSPLHQGYWVSFPITPDADQLSLFLVGEGTNNTLRLNDSEFLDVSTLGALLDTVQSNGCEVAAMLEFSGSGAFVEAMPPPLGASRILLASSAPNRPSRPARNGVRTNARLSCGGAVMTSPPWG